MVECHQFLRDNIGFKMKNKIPAAPPGTHGVIFYKFCRLLTAAVPVLARPAWSARQQLSFVSPLSSLLSLPCQDSRLMKPPGELRHCNTFPVIRSQSLHSPGQATSYLTPPWSASEGMLSCCRTLQQLVAVKHRNCNTCMPGVWPGARPFCITGTILGGGLIHYDILIVI